MPRRRHDQPKSRRRVAACSAWVAAARSPRATFAPSGTRWAFSRPATKASCVRRKGEVVWQDYNPYPKFQGRDLDPELVFVRDDMTRHHRARSIPTSRSWRTSRKCCFHFPPASRRRWGQGESDRAGSHRRQASPARSTSTSCRPTAWTRGCWPATAASQARAATSWPPGFAARANRRRRRGEKATDKRQNRSRSSRRLSTSDAAKKPGGINVIYVTDIDLLSSQFVQMRNEPNMMITKFRFDNVPFVCNLIDAVGGEDRFLEIRKRKPKHSTLRMVEFRAAKAREQQKDADRKDTGRVRRRREEGRRRQGKDVCRIQEDLRRAAAEAEPRRRGRSGQDSGGRHAAGHEAADGRAGRGSGQDRPRTEARPGAGPDRARARPADSSRFKTNTSCRPRCFRPFCRCLVGLVVWARRRIREREGVSRTRMRL